MTESIALLPILRAGLPMSDALLRLFPEARCFHLGLFREKVSLQPVECELTRIIPIIFLVTKESPTPTLSPLN